MFRSSPRQADLLIVSGRVAHKMAAPLRQIYDQMLEPKWVIAMGACASSGGMFNNYTILQGVDKIVAVDIHVPGCPPRPEALIEGIVRLQEKIQAGVPPAYEIRGVAVVTYEGVPGLVETQEAHGETTLVVDPARLVEACLHLRDEEGFNFLSDITPTDYLGWGERGVAGYFGTARGPRPQRAGLAGPRRARPSRSRSASRSTTTCSASRRRARASACRSGSTTASRSTSVDLGLADRRLARARGLGHDGHPGSTATRTSPAS